MTVTRDYDLGERAVAHLLGLPAAAWIGPDAKWGWPELQSFVLSAIESHIGGASTPVALHVWQDPTDINCNVFNLRIDEL